MSKVIIRKLLATAFTSSGERIVLPRRNVWLTASVYTIAPGAVLPVHKHPFPRFGYLLSGKLSVTDTTSGRAEVYHPGNFIVEMVGRWHRGQNVGTVAANLLVIDLIEGYANNVLLRE